MAVVVELAERELDALFGEQLFAQVSVKRKRHLVGVHVGANLQATLAQQARRLDGALVRVRTVSGHAALVVNFLGAVDGQEHRAYAAIGNELGFWLIYDVRVRKHHSVVGDALCIAETRELFRERLHNVERERRIATVPLHRQRFEPFDSMTVANEFDNHIHHALVHLAWDFVVSQLIAVRAAEITCIRGDEAERH